MTLLAFTSNALLTLTLILTLFGVVYCSYQLLYAKKANSSLVEHINSFISIVYIFASLVLLYAFYSCEFSYRYVYGYSDSALPLFYRLTAFWGGQAGSLLFWALSVVLCGLYFQTTKTYKTLSDDTRCWYLVFYFIGIAFFSLLLTTHNDPFELFPPSHIPTDGFGLNPLLQHPGMIFHPPLLLLGYGGFTIPACLALAQAMTQSSYPNEISWHKATMPLTLTAWLLLSAGILLGAWWAYMELGWGGYWAWDPVENASLIPWFFGTAAIHLGFLNAYRDKAGRVHTLTMALTYVSAFFATWLVRGNVVASVHAFGGSGIGGILGYYVLFTAIAVCGIVCIMPKKENQLGGPESREGLIVSTTILLITISIIIMIATLWPVISVLPSTLFGDGTAVPAQGLGVDFYNTIILPLLTLIIAILMFCPWVSWTGKILSKKYFLAVVLIFMANMLILWTFFDIKIPAALLGASVSITCMISWALFIYHQKYNKLSPSLVHIGFAMMGLGVAISGPYQIEEDLILSRGQSIYIDGFDVKLNQIYMVPVYRHATLIISKDGKSDTLNVGHSQPLKIGDYVIEIADIIDNRQADHGRDIDLIVTKKDNTQSNDTSTNDSSFVTHIAMGKPVSIADFTVTATHKHLNRYSFIEAELEVSIDGKEHGILAPQRRRYATHPNNIYSEAVTIFSLGKEIYATFSGLDSEDRARLRILVQPMVNWIWIGSAIMCLAPFLSLYGISNRRRKPEDLDE